MRKILCSSARDIGELGFDTDSGWGILDLTAVSMLKKNGSI